MKKSEAMLAVSELQWRATNKSAYFALLFVISLVIPNGFEGVDPSKSKISESLSRASCLRQRRGKSLLSGLPNYLVLQHKPKNKPLRDHCNYVTAGEFEN